MKNQTRRSTGRGRLSAEGGELRLRVGPPPGPGVAPTSQAVGVGGGSLAKPSP